MSHIHLEHFYKKVVKIYSFKVSVKAGKMAWWVHTNADSGPLESAFPESVPATQGSSSELGGGSKRMQATKMDGENKNPGRFTDLQVCVLHTSPRTKMHKTLQIQNTTTTHLKFFNQYFTAHNVFLLLYLKS